MKVICVPLFKSKSKAEEVKPKEESLITPGHKYNSKVMELIRRRRLQTLVTSYIYMEMDESYIPDEEWNRRSHELADLQNKYPLESAAVVYADKFLNWTGDTASGLTYDDWVVSAATHLMDYRDKENSR